MGSVNLNSNKVLKILTQHILISLNELFESKTPSEFNEGGRYAFIEYLEIISGWSNFSNYGIDDIEQMYPI